MKSNRFCSITWKQTNKRLTNNKLEQTHLIEKHYHMNGVLKACSSETPVGTSILIHCENAGIEVRIFGPPSKHIKI